MMTLDELTPYLTAEHDGRFVMKFPEVDGKAVQRAGVVLTHLHCSQAKTETDYLFAIADTADGQVAVIFEGHLSLYPSLQGLLETSPRVLNVRELVLLEFNVQK